MPNVGGFGPITIAKNGTPTQSLPPVTIVDPNQGNTTNLNPPIASRPPGYDHSDLTGLSDDDHPQYLKKTDASTIYQEKIWIGPTPPPNPQLYKIWIQI